MLNSSHSLELYLKLSYVLQSSVQVRDLTKNESVNNEDGDNDDEDGPVPAKRVRKVNF